MSDLKTITSREAIAEIARSIPKEQLKRKTVEKIQRPKRKGMVMHKPQMGLTKNGLPDKRSVHGRRIIEKMSQMGNGKQTAEQANNEVASDEILDKKRQAALDKIKNWDPSNYTKDPNEDIDETTRLALEAINENRAKRQEVSNDSNANYLEGLKQRQGLELSFQTNLDLKDEKDRKQFLDDNDEFLRLLSRKKDVTPEDVLHARQAAIQIPTVLVGKLH